MSHHLGDLGDPHGPLGLGLLGCMDVLVMPRKRELLEGRNTNTMAMFGSKSLLVGHLLEQ